MSDLPVSIYSWTLIPDAQLELRIAWGRYSKFVRTVVSFRSQDLVYSDLY